MGWGWNRKPDNGGMKYNLDIVSKSSISNLTIITLALSFQIFFDSVKLYNKTNKNREVKRNRNDFNEGSDHY